MQSRTAERLFFLPPFLPLLLGLTLLGLMQSLALAAGSAPLPLPRPDIHTRSGSDDKATPNPPLPQVRPKAQAAKPAYAGPPFDLEEAKLCEAELTKRGVRFSLLPALVDPGGCGATRPLHIHQMGGDILLGEKTILQCGAALALDRWAKETVGPAASLHLDANLAGIEVGTSYHCRARNNATGGKLSEHAFANGIDIGAFSFENRPTVRVQLHSEGDRGPTKFQAAVRGAACAYFSTVIGPGTNEAHADHLHLDMAYRKGGFRLCE